MSEQAPSILIEVGKDAQNEPLLCIYPTNGTQEPKHIEVGEFYALNSDATTRDILRTVETALAKLLNNSGQFGTMAHSLSNVTDAWAKLHEDTKAELESIDRIVRNAPN